MGTLVGIIAVVLTLACLLLSGSRCFSQTPSSPPAGKPSSPPAATAAEKMKSLDRERIRAMLKKLADTSPPKERAFGAMCYEVAPPPNRADYVCPKCGERTMYDDSKRRTEGQPRAELAEIVEWDIPACRREMQQLRKLTGDAIVLDESQFCRKCSPKVTAPKLVLRMSYKGEKPRDVEKIAHADLRILREFLSGKLLAKGENDGESPLKDQLPRLQELLGEKLEK